jgi:hypothetical protein
MSSFSVDKKIKRIYMQIEIKLEAQPTEPVLLTFQPQLQESSLKIYLKLLQISKFPRQSCLYLLQIMHHR